MTEPATGPATGPVDRGSRPPRRRARPRARLPLVVGAGSARPDGGRGRPRQPRLGPRRPRVPGLLQPAGQRQHRPPAPRTSSRRSRSRPRSWPPSPRPPPTSTRGEAAKRITAPCARRLQQGLLHQRRRRRQRERHPDGPAAHRARQGRLDLPQLPRQHRVGDRRDGRLAARAQRVRPRARPRLRPLPLPLRVLGDHARGGERARAAAPRPGRRVRGPGLASPRSCSRPCPAPPAC